MQAVFKVPDDPVAKFQAVGDEVGVKEDVEGENLPLVDVIADLPAYAAIVGGDPDALFDDSGLLFEVNLDVEFSLVRLANVVWRGGDDESGSAIRYLGQELHAVALVNRDAGRGRVPVRRHEAALAIERQLLVNDGGFVVRFSPRHLSARRLTMFALNMTHQGPWVKGLARRQGVRGPPR